MNFNQVIIAGNLTRDPEIRRTQTGTAVTSIGLAINRKYTANGETKEEVAFVDATAFGKTAEAIGQYLRKGRGIFINGRLKTETWQDKTTGKNRSKLLVIVDTFQFVDKQASAGDGESPSPAAAPRPQPKPAAAETATPIEDDSVPF